MITLHPPPIERPLYSDLRKINSTDNNNNIIIIKNSHLLTNCYA